MRRRHGDARGEALDPRTGKHAAAGNGGPGEAGLNDHDVHDVLDLCLECRACKAECPVGVDVARFKSEFLATYWGRHGLPMRVRTIGHAEAARPAAASRRCRTSSAERRRLVINEQLLGIDRRRTPPAYARGNLRATIRELLLPGSPLHQAASLQPQAPAWFSNDTFTNYNHPEIGVAAASLWTPPATLASGAARMLRPSADLARAAGRGARCGACAMDALHDTSRSRRPGSSSSSRAASAVREDAPGLLRRAAAGSGCRHGVHAVRGLRRGGMAPRPDQRCAATGAVNRPAARPLSSESDGPDAVRTRAAACRRARSSISTRDADGRVVRLREGALRGLAPIGERKLLPAVLRTQCFSPPAPRAGAGEHFTGVMHSTWRNGLASLARRP